MARDCGGTRAEARPVLLRWTSCKHVTVVPAASTVHRIPRGLRGAIAGPSPLTPLTLKSHPNSTASDKARTVRFPRGWHPVLRLSGPSADRARAPPAAAAAQQLGEGRAGAGRGGSPLRTRVRLHVDERPRLSELTHVRGKDRGCFKAKRRPVPILSVHGERKECNS